MNSHLFYDRLTIALAAIAFRRFRFFAGSLDGPDLPAHIAAARLQLPDFPGDGTYEVQADTLAGRQDPAFRVVQWLGPEYPTLLYHHGNNERPFDFGLASKNTFKNILMSGREHFPANLVALRAPYHQALRIYLQQARRLDHFAAMLGTSVCLVEALVSALREKSSMPVMVAGISLGGWVTNLHKAIFDSADAYAPMLAGAALDEVFISSAYRRLAGENVAANPEPVRAVLNFEAAYSRVHLDNVYPLLARHDPIAEYERQSSCYRERPVTVLDKGHTTATLAYGLLRSHLLATLQQTPSSVNRSEKRSIERQTG